MQISKRKESVLPCCNKISGSLKKKKSVLRYCFPNTYPDEMGYVNHYQALGQKILTAEPKWLHSTKKILRNEKREKEKNYIKAFITTFTLTPTSTNMDTKTSLRSLLTWFQTCILFRVKSFFYSGERSS